MRQIFEKAQSRFLRTISTISSALTSWGHKTVNPPTPARGKDVSPPFLLGYAEAAQPPLDRAAPETEGSFQPDIQLSGR